MNSLDNADIISRTKQAFGSKFKMEMEPLLPKLADVE
jgi:hypothetical protein